MENGNQPAFGYGFANEQHHLEEKGLTKREYFAAMALQHVSSYRNTVRKLAYIPCYVPFLFTN